METEDARRVWKVFIPADMDAQVRKDYFTSEVWEWCGLMTYDMLRFVEPRSQKVHLAGMIPYPNGRRMGKDVTMADNRFVPLGHDLIHDREGKFGFAEPRLCET
jgi:putative transposase